MQQALQECIDVINNFHHKIGNIIYVDLDGSFIMKDPSTLDKSECVRCTLRS